MADFDTSVVIQAYDGELFAAPAGTAVPTDGTTALDAAYKSVGWLTEDGLTFTPNVKADDPIKGWPRGEVLLRPTATLEPEFKFAMAQHDSDTLDWITNPSAGYCLVLEYRATVTSKKHRLVLPKVKISDAGDVPFNTSDLVSVEVTVGCQRDDTAGYTFAFMIPTGTGDTYTTKKY